VGVVFYEPSEELRKTPDGGNTMTGKLKKTLAGSLLAVIVFGSMAMAQPNINQRQKNQQQRIGQGVQSGQLTPQDTVRLENKQQRIARNEAAAKSDGN
jgi:hypothetical protein